VSPIEFSSEPWLKARALAREARRVYAHRFERDRNIVGTAFGQREAHGEKTEEPALVIYVAHKTPEAFLPPSRRLPRRIHLGRDCVEVDVVQTGFFYPLAFTARERPAPIGVSIGHPSITAGTLGALVLDNTDRSLCILSNNHVIANQNAANLGDPTIQPGTFDGGVSPDDDIATLKRFVTINMTGNTVDGAIAEVTAADNVQDQVKDNLMPIPNPDHPPVGLLFAGSCNRTLMNPIRDVLTQLDISFTKGGMAAAEVGMNVEKVGRTTEYTTSTVTEVDVTVTIDYNFGPATFDDQIATAWMSDGGDSGSVVCVGGEGGKGGSEDHCGCGSTSAAETLLGTSLKPEAALAEDVRDRYLRQTRVGRWAVDVFYLNEERLLERFRTMQVAEDDVRYARRLFEKYREDVRRAFVEAERSEATLNQTHLRDARQALEVAQRYMTSEEAEAARQLFELATRAEGQNVRGVLSMLNDDEIFERVRSILRRVGTIECK